MCDLDNVFFPEAAPIGYNKDLNPIALSLNTLGYAEGINTVAQWAGHTISALAYGIWVSRVAGVARIVLAIYNYWVGPGVFYEQYRNVFIGHLIRGSLEIAGLGLALLAVDVIATIYKGCYDRRSAPTSAHTYTSSSRLVGLED